MVDFAGWSLPVQYSELGIIESCLHTRSRASLFDVSHMLQVGVFGRDREDFIESLTVGDIKGLKEGESRLSVFTNENGGIIDDTVVTKRKDSLAIVLNAGCADKDLKHIQSAVKRFGKDVELVVNRERSLMALQGPQSVSVLQQLMSVDLSRVAFMHSLDNVVVAGIEGCSISRSGYTGEDGFEISVPTDDGTNHIAESLMGQKDTVKLAGLGARDTLRIEAGLCLYGSDIDEKTTPIEAGLAWTVGKRRRAEAGFPGADKILYQITQGVSKKRVGLMVNSGPPARHDNLIYAGDSIVGKTTSGTFSPSLGKPVSIGYIATQHSALGTELSVDVRAKKNSVTITKMPFVKANYYRIP